MNQNPTNATQEIFRIVGELVAEKPAVAKAFAERLAGLLTPPSINVFELYAEQDVAATKKALGKLSVPDLFAIIYKHDFSPQEIPVKAAKKAALVQHILDHLKEEFSENSLLSRQ